jgi:hypothetical protein
MVHGTHSTQFCRFNVIEQLNILKIVTERLEQVGIAYMVSGSIAINYYAQPRLTRDIDIVVELLLHQVDSIIKLFSADFYLNEEMIYSAILPPGLFNLIHLESLVKIDLIVRKTATYRQVEFARRQLAKIEDMMVWIVSPEDLLLSKLVWAKDSHSEMQLNDVRGLINSVNTLDWHYIREWATQLDVTALLAEVQK